MDRFECVSHTKQTIILLQAEASAFCLNSQTWKLAVIKRLPKYEVPQISIQNISPCHIFVKLLSKWLCPVENLHTGTSTWSPADSLGKRGLCTP